MKHEQICMHHLNRYLPLQLFIAPQSGVGISFTLSTTNAVWQLHTLVSSRDIHKNRCKFFAFILLIIDTNLYASPIEIFFFAAFRRTTIQGLIHMLYSINRRVRKDCITHNCTPHVPVDLQEHACSKFRIGLRTSTKTIHKFFVITLST